MVRNCKISMLLLILVSTTVALSGVGPSLARHLAHIKNQNPTTNTSEVRSLLAQAKSAALRIKNDYQRGLVLDEIGAAEAKNGDLDTAVKTANRAYPHIMATVTAIGKELGNSNDLSRAKYLGSQLKGGGSSTLFYHLVQRQAEKGRIAEALQTVRQIQAPEVRRGALELIAEQQGVNGEYSGARKTLALARAAYPDERSTLDDIEMMVAGAQFSRGDTEAARKTIAAMKSPESRFSMMVSGAAALLIAKDTAGATALLEDALQQLPPGPSHDFLPYLAIPTQVKVGKKDAAMQAAGALAGDLREKGYMAIAVVCAETKDIDCVDAALAKMRSAATAERNDEGSSDYVVRSRILNVTAALINTGQFEAATRLLATVEQDLNDEASRVSIIPEVQFQRVVILAQQNAFTSARSLSLSMQSNSALSSEINRGTALRTIAVLETRKNGVAATKLWVLRLADDVERASAFLGIAQSLLKIDDIKLPYSAIQIH